MTSIPSGRLLSVVSEGGHARLHTIDDHAGAEPGKPATRGSAMDGCPGDPANARLEHPWVW